MTSFVDLHLDQLRIEQQDQAAEELFKGGRYRRVCGEQTCKLRQALTWLGTSVEAVVKVKNCWLP